MRRKDVFVTQAQMQKLIKSGRMAIEYRLLGVIVQPRDLKGADHAEMEQLTALLKSYNELMADPEKPPTPTNEANNEKGGKV